MLVAHHSLKIYSLFECIAHNSGRRIRWKLTAFQRLHNFISECKYSEKKNCFSSISCFHFYKWGHACRGEKKPRIVLYILQTESKTAAAGRKTEIKNLKLPRVLERTRTRTQIRKRERERKTKLKIEQKKRVKSPFHLQFSQCERVIRGGKNHKHFEVFPFFA